MLVWRYSAASSGRLPSSEEVIYSIADANRRNGSISSIFFNER